MSKKKTQKDSVDINLEFSKVEKKWLPTLGGSTCGYEPQYRPDSGSQWMRLPTEQSTAGKGAPYPYCDGGIFVTIGLHGHAQAQAIAWGYKATCEAQGDLFTEIRVAEYEVVFDIKARKIEGEL